MLLVLVAVICAITQQEKASAKTESACQINNDRFGPAKLKGAKKPATRGMYMYAPVDALGRCGRNSCAAWSNGEFANESACGAG